MASLEELKAGAGVDMSSSGLRFLPEETQHRILSNKKSNKFEKVKAAKCGSTMWTEVETLAQLLRNGDVKWEDLDLDDVDIRMKWSGLFHRGKRTPGRFMMRLKVPQGVLNAEQLRALATCIEPYGEDGCADITTRANIQLRGVKLDDADRVMQTLRNVGLSSLMSGMDNIRNITGSPIAGIDPEELIDSRPLVQELQDVITNHGLGNAELTNLPRKINVGISTSRDDFAHCHINDVGLKAVTHPDTGDVGFNVELGGYFSIKRNTMSIPGDTFITPDQVAAYCKGLMEVFRDHGERTDRQKARLMWLVEAVGVHQFRRMVAERMGLDDLPGEVHVQYPDAFQRRDILGIHKQKQEDKYWIGACIPAGRIVAKDFEDLAEVATKYGDGSVRVTVEQNVVIPNVDEADLEAIQGEGIFEKFQIFPGKLMAGLVSCTGSQFCGLALVETKNRAMAIVRKLEEELDIPSLVRMHWTGCPNSCGQAQVGDIGLMGAPAKKDGKAVEGVRIFLGGEIGENPKLASEFEKSVPATEEDLLPVLKRILVENFGAKER
jgi:ferredoxin-nitrite reductase